MNSSTTLKINSVNAHENSIKNTRALSHGNLPFAHDEQPIVASRSKQ
jgi:hypothetical protein